MEALLNRLPHFFPELFSRNIGWRWWWGEKRQPDLLNPCLQFAPRSGAFLDHASPTFPVQSAEVRRKTRWHLRVRTIGNGQALQQVIKSQLLLFEKCDMFF